MRKNNAKHDGSFLERSETRWNKLLILHTKPIPPINMREGELTHTERNLNFVVLLYIGKNRDFSTIQRREANVLVLRGNRGSA